MKTRNTILTSKELGSLKKELRGSYIATAIVYLIVFFVAFVSGSPEEEYYLSFNGLVGLAVLIMVILVIARYLTKDHRTELRANKKIIQTLKIEEKYHYQDKKDKCSPEYTRYVIVAEGKKHDVDEELYKRADINDSLNIHRTYCREVIIKKELVKN